MKSKIQLVVGLLVIDMVILACGPSTGVQVLTSTEGGEEVKATNPAKVGMSRINPTPDRVKVAGSYIITDSTPFGSFVNIPRQKKLFKSKERLV